MANEEERDANEMDEHSQQELCNVQANDSVANFLFDVRGVRGQTGVSALHGTKAYFVMIYRRMAEVVGLCGHSPPREDEGASDEEVIDRVCPPPPRKHNVCISWYYNKSRTSVQWTYRLVKVRRYRGMRTPMGKRTRKEMLISKAWSLTLFS